MCSSPVPLKIYTDGSCLGPPGKVGGWAAILERKGDSLELTGGEEVSTNNRAELMAVIMALRAIPESFVGPVIVFSDSKYVTRSVTNGSMRRWQRFDWHVNEEQTKSLVNGLLWQELAFLLDRRPDVTFRWVRGHSGNSKSVQADKLARKAATDVLAQQEFWQRNAQEVLVDRS